MLIDTHAHLTDERFDQDRTEVIKRAKTAGVSKIIEIACEPQYWQKALDLAAENDGIYCALGIHPQDARLCEPNVLEDLERFARLPGTVAIGETGLDYYHENSPRQKQREVFIKHIELSLKIDKPIIIHCREAYPDLMDILKGMKFRGVVHCFSGSTKDAEKLIEMGFYIGIDGPVTYPRAEELRKTAEALPPERILIETDSPYLPPQLFRGKRNEPSYILCIAEEISKIKSIEFKALLEIINHNTQLLFRLK